MRVNLLVILSVIFVSCAKQVSTQATPQDLGPWVVEENSITENSLQIRLRNTSDKPLVVHRPMEKKVSYNADGSWEAIDILYCDCGVSCAPQSQ